MTGLVVLSIACAAFVAGFTFGLMFFAMVRSHYEKDQSPRSPSAH